MRATRSTESTAWSLELDGIFVSFSKDWVGRNGRHSGICLDEKGVSLGAFLFHPLFAHLGNFIVTSCLFLS